MNGADYSVVRFSVLLGHGVLHHYNVGGGAEAGEGWPRCGPRAKHREHLQDPPQRHPAACRSLLCLYPADSKGEFGTVAIFLCPSTAKTARCHWCYKHVIGVTNMSLVLQTCHWCYKHVIGVTNMSLVLQTVPQLAMHSAPSFLHELVTQVLGSLARLVFTSECPL